MGTTIRRQPVNFDIPASPNYKFLNITNFRGLDISSNPFELATNTASDCLNVYVDETNTLTTRPRLEKKISTPLAGRHIATYNSHNGYLLHYAQNEEGVLVRLVDGVLHNVSGTLSLNKCQYFEQGDKIYLLDGERYMVISDDVLSDVEGYVPTTSVTTITGTKKSIEGVNLLSSVYKEAYDWDGVTTQHLPDNLVSAQNEYYKQTYRLGARLQRYYDDKSGVMLYGVTFRYSDNLFTDQTGVDVCTLTTTSFADIGWYISKTEQTKTIGFLDMANKKLHFYTKTTSGWAHTTFNAPLNTASLYGETGFGFSPNKKIIWVDTSDGFKFYKLSDTASEYEAVSIGQRIIAIDCNKYGEVAAIAENTDNTSQVVLLYNENIEQSVAFTQIIDDAPLTVVVKPGISKNGDVCWVQSNNSIRMFFKDTDNVFSKVSSRKIDVPTNVTVEEFQFDDVRKISWFRDSVNSQLYINSDYTKYLYRNTYVTVPQPIVEMQAGQFIIMYFPIFEWSSEAKSAIWGTLTAEDDDEWKTHRQTLLKSTLFTRFDNNYWLAGGNRYYRSQNNDPTYFPITEYNDLGDSNEEITGFNLANDTTLIAYKKDRVYLIQPFTSSLDTIEYTITESKNTVGNTAIGAPIVTTLTEIPLQINNDGIYGLSQVSNVSSTERIADLMSESINERWLNEDDKIIKNALTLNRLYWTYIILPYIDKNITKIYLLDNRTNSWYYWELPIVVLNAFVKDNRSEFVDADGNIYYLTATDIEKRLH